MGSKQAIRFWLQDRNVVGEAIAKSNNDSSQLAEYQGRLYVIRDDAAVPIGRSLHFTRNTLPLNLKRVFGLAPPRPEKTSKKKVSRSEQAKSIPSESSPIISIEDSPPRSGIEPEKETRAVLSQEKKTKEAANNPEKRKRMSAPRKLDRKAHPIEIDCPYCKNANGFQVKPEGDKFVVSDGKKSRVEESAFFLQCAKCKEMFAVRLIPVTTYSAQVAGFT